MRISRIVTLAALAIPVMALAQSAPRDNAIVARKPALLATQLLTPTPDELAGLRKAKSLSARTLDLVNSYRARLKSPPVDIEAVNRTQVPVLFLAAAPFLKSFRIFSTRDHFVLSGGDETNGYVLTGTRVTQVLKGQSEIPPLDTKLQALFAQDRTVSGTSDPIADLSVSTTEDGIEASFRRFGALYDLRIACAQKDSPACSQESILKLIAGATVLGGGQ